jgi:hypothetical protein
MLEIGLSFSRSFIPKPFSLPACSESVYAHHLDQVKQVLQKPYQFSLLPEKLAYERDASNPLTTDDARSFKQHKP